jgi:hypothetical protein
MPAKSAKANGDDAIPISELLRVAGFEGSAAMRQARSVLERASLTRPGKQGIAGSKRERALTLLHDSLIAVCGRECAELAGGARTPVVTSGARCEVCRGSNNRRAALAARRALLGRRLTRVLVVGGSPPQQHDLASLLNGEGISLEFVDGLQGSHSQKDALANMRRADLVVIWGSTPLRHTVSERYTRDAVPGVSVITTPRRGIEALCREIQRHASPRDGRRR